MSVKALHELVHVAAAAVRNARGEVLVALRPAHVHQGGLWEFPGGKLERGESAEQALIRELQEELGIAPLQRRPLIRIEHAYPDKRVCLDVWQVDRFAGEVRGREGQEVRWVTPEALTQLSLPAANRPIVTAVRLPDRYLVTGAFASREEFAGRLEGALDAGVRLVQLRAGNLAPQDYRLLARDALTRARARGAQLLLNAEPALAEELDADGVHLNSARLRACATRPLARDKWVAASVHDADELRHAEAVGVDFVVLGPVAPTRSHPGARPLGWARFAELVRASRVPVYALGGLGLAQLDTAFSAGAQGVAAIGALWRSPGEEAAP